MSGNGHLTAAQIRSSLDHPVIDGDGHWVEFDPVFSRADAKGRRRPGGRRVPRRAEDHAGRAEHVARRAAAPARRPAGLLDPPGRQHAGSRDRDDAAPALRAPRRVRLRLRDHLSDRGPARAAHQRRRHPARGRSRAQHRDRGLLPQAERPDDPGRDHPDAHAGRGHRRARVRHQASSGSKVGHVRQRHVAAKCRRLRRPIRTATRLAVWYDVLALDSDYDYDPVWAKCRGARHRADLPQRGQQPGPAQLSPSNFVYNHIGHFAAAGHAVSKAIFLGGVTRRFPELRFAFLEGGVGWACQLFGDLMEHWERRNRKALENMDPRKLDRALLMSLAEKYGDPDVAGSRCGSTRRLAGPRPEPDGRRRGSRRLLRVQDQPEAGLDRPLRQAVLLRLRGRRPGHRVGVQQAQSVRHQAERALQLGHRPLRRDRHAPSAAGGVRAGRRRAPSRRTTSATSCSRTPCTSGGRRTRSSSRAPGWPRRPRPSWRAASRS